ncbi:MAG: pyrroline-5-carboxylate reductase [Porticoccaceae bacterium]|nr:pyrroline-5-carboxylate reductase [Porticoccaceae bacterium]
MSKPKLVFIGGGNMATSLIGGLLKQGFPTANIAVTDPVPETRQGLESEFNITTYETNDCARDADIVVLAVKPQIMKVVASDLAPVVTLKPLVISIAAGIPVAALRGWLGDNIPLVRCMPNTPALVQKGATGLFATDDVSAEQRTLTETIISAVGTVNWFDTELDIDRVTALSGSGPAYFFLVMEAMEDAGVKLGLDRDTARQMTIQTALGAASMAAQGEFEPGELRKRVTSPGGTTESAIKTFISGKLPGLFEQAMEAAYQRSIEIADEAL